MTDETLVELIRSNDPVKRNWALYQFYNNTLIRDWMKKYDYNNPQITGYLEDIFQEAMLVFDRNIRENRFEGKSSLSTYLISIIKWMILGHQRKTKQTQEFKHEHMNGETESADFEMISDEKRNVLEEALLQIDSRCQELLRHYKLDYSMKEISEIMGFSSPEMAKKQAYRCRERLRTVLQSNPELVKILKED